MVDVLFSRPQALRVHNDHVDDFVILIVGNERLAPYPDSFCLGISGWTHRETLLSVENDLVQQKRLACAVNTCDRNDSHFALEGIEEM